MAFRINTPLRNYFFYKSGEFIRQPLEDGFIYFFENADHSTPLNTYQDAEFTIPYPNPLPLDGDGGCPPIYMEDAPYYIEVRSSDATGQQLQFTLNNYEGAIFNNGITPVEDSSTTNYFIDGQFDTGDFNGPTAAGIQTISAADWEFERDGTVTDTLNFYTFAVGDTTVPQNPLNALQYVVTGTPSAETVSRFYYPFKYVRTLEGVQVTFSFWAKAASAITITPFYEQNFGTGGSPSTANNVSLTPINLTTTWARYYQTFTIASAAGETLGTNGDDRLLVGINFPLNTVQNSYFTNMLLEEGNQENEYPYQTYEQVNGELGSYIVGEIRAFSRIRAPLGWLITNGNSISRTQYFDLFEATTFLQTGSTTNGDGVITGLTNTGYMYVGMQITHPNYGGGTGVLTIVSVDSSTQITVNHNSTATGSVPVRFYINGAGDGSTTFNVPNIGSRAIVGAYGSVSGIPVVVGSTGGSATHTMTEAELVPHTHSYTSASFVSLGTTGGASAEIAAAATTGSTGGGDPFSIVQPVWAGLVCIKY